MSTGRHTSDEGWGFESVEPPGQEHPDHDRADPAANATEAEDRPEGRPGEDGAAPARRWDADDERRRADCFAPPQEPCECYCLHCGRVFMSDRIWFQRIIGDPMGLDGFWMCPTPNCDGAGFTFDIFPTDPEHPANEGWVYDDGDEEEGVEFADEPDDGADAEWDPEETKYKELDEAFGDGEPFEDDLEGEEWKYGLEPGERPGVQSDWAETARREQEEEERKYDEPDQRPRVLDWTNREDRKPREPGPPGTPGGYDDIPF
jgi:hypothetical protein